MNNKIATSSGFVWMVAMTASIPLTACYGDSDDNDGREMATPSTFLPGYGEDEIGFRSGGAQEGHNGASGGNEAAAVPIAMPDDSNDAEDGSSPSQQPEVVPDPEPQQPEITENPFYETSTMPTSTFLSLPKKKYLTPIRKKPTRTRLMKRPNSSPWETRSSWPSACATRIQRATRVSC